MKFGQRYRIYVQKEAQSLLPECPFVEFKRFKKLLKKCPHLHAASRDSGSGATSTEDDSKLVIDGDENMDNASNACQESSSSNGIVRRTPSSPCPVCDAEFFPDLDKAVSAVVGCFNARAKELLRLHMASGLRKFLVRLRSKVPGDPQTMIQVGSTLVSYGCMNALAVRKILKKYDKVHGSEIGRAFKSRLQVKRVELLQSPLLIELGALAVNLMDSEVPHGLAGTGNLACNFDEEKKTICCVLADGLRLDFDLTCSICLDVVFDPVALGCGHIFCTSCACTAASIPAFLGATEAKRSAKCPLCRQAGVYPHAVQLGELYRLVSNRCSEYYNERLPAEREQRVREAKEHWDREMQSIIGF